MPKCEGHFSTFPIIVEHGCRTLHHWSQPVVPLHYSCIIHLPFSRKVATKPRGSYIESWPMQACLFWWGACPSVQSQTGGVLTQYTIVPLVLFLLVGGLSSRPGLWYHWHVDPCVWLLQLSNHLILPCGNWTPFQHTSCSYSVSERGLERSKEPM